jgi:DNA topoisomerase I
MVALRLTVDEPVKPVKRDPCDVVGRGCRSRWWRRVGTKERGFHYEDPSGTRIRDKKVLERIKALKIPPAWSEARINPSPNGRLQAVGIDTSGRVQYLYHAKFAESRSRKKFAKIERFGEKLPELRRATNEDIERKGFPRDRVLAVVIRLINELYFRLGTEASVKQYKTYGVTTLRNRHLEILPGGRLVFRFTGKHHIYHRHVLVDRELAALMKQIKAIRGSRLFNYIGEDGKPHPVTPRDVNDYIKAATGPEFSAKDFRTWGGTLLAAIALAEIGSAENERKAKRNMVQAVKRVAEHLGNTPTVCRSCYIHPVVFERYREGVTLDEFRKRAERAIRRTQPEYEVEELALIKLFKAGEAAKAPGPSDTRQET